MTTRSVEGLALAGQHHPDLPVVVHSRDGQIEAGAAFVIPATVATGIRVGVCGSR